MVTMQKEIFGLYASNSLNANERIEFYDNS